LSKHSSEINKAIVEKGNKRNVPMIGNVFAKRKTKRKNSYVDIDNNSQQVLRIY